MSTVIHGMKLNMSVYGNTAKEIHDNAIIQACNFFGVRECCITLSPGQLASAIYWSYSDPRGKFYAAISASLK